MKALIMILPVVTTFAGCMRGGGDSPPVVSHNYELVIDGTGYARQDPVHPGFILGGNVGSWSANLINPKSGELMKGLGHGIIRFPGGDAANDYCWIYELEEGEDWRINIDEYIAFLKENEMKPLFGVNIFDHERSDVQHNALEEAVALVEYMKEQGLGGGYYEIGNENDGAWNAHDGQQLTIDKYLEKYFLFAEAMKEADPEIKLLGPAVSGYDADYHKPYISGFIEEMSGKGELVDYFSYHYYGDTWINHNQHHGIDLNKPQLLAGQVQDIRSRLAAAGLSHVKLGITEYNAAVWGDGDVDKCVIKQGLWLADFIGEAFSHLDLATVWISLTPAYNPVTKPDGDPHALIDESAVCPAKNYWPCALAFKVLANADRNNPLHVLQVDSPAPTSQMTVYATKAADDSWAGVMLINKSNAAVTVEISMENFPDFTGLHGRRMGEKEYNAGYNNYETLVEFIPALEGNVISLDLPPLSIVGVSAACEEK